MKNAIIPMLLVLVTVSLAGSGVLGYFILTQQRSIECIASELATAREEIFTQSTELENARHELFNQSNETNRRLSDINIKIDENHTSLNNESMRISSITDELSILSSDVSNIVPGFAADELFNKVAKSVVQITDGQQIIGAGFLYDTKGLIVTAYHVVEDVKEVHVVFFDGTYGRANIISSSKYSDIGLLQLQNETTVEPVQIGDSSTLTVGSNLLVVGHPFDMRNSLSVGVVSNLDEFVEIGSGRDKKWIANLIQFDAPCNFGNSGGPIFDANGKFSGMVIARIDPESGDGVSYAVSSNKIKRCVDDMIRDGRYYHPYLGIYAVDLTPLDCYDHAFKTVQGAYVQYVNGGARNAGLMQGDLIISVNGFTIHDVAELASTTCEHVRYKGSAQIRLIRAGEQLDFEILTGYRAESISEVTGIPTTNSSSDAPDLPSI